MRMALKASHICGSEDIRPGQGIQQAYPFVVSFLDGNGWHEAVDRYRDWALAQPWCARGPLCALDETQKSTWLLEKAGLCTFGINGMHDRTAWIKRYHEDIGAPVFHVLGPDCTNEQQTFGYGVPGGMKDWLPTVLPVRKEGRMGHGRTPVCLADGRKRVDLARRCRKQPQIMPGGEHDQLRLHARPVGRRPPAA